MIRFLGYACSTSIRNFVKRTSLVSFRRSLHLWKWVIVEYLVVYYRSIENILPSGNHKANVAVASTREGEKKWDNLVQKLAFRKPSTPLSPHLALIASLVGIWNEKWVQTLSFNVEALKNDDHCSIQNVQKVAIKDFVQILSADGVQSF